MNIYSTVNKIYCGRNIVSEVMYHVFRQFQRNTIEKNAVFMKKTNRLTCRQIAEMQRQNGTRNRI